MRRSAVMLAAVIVAAMVSVAPSPMAQAAEVCQTRTWDGFVDPDPTLQRNGDAQVVGGRMRVTPALGSQAGSVFTMDAIALADDVSFSTYFEFQFTGQGFGGADGLVFVVQTVSNAVGGHGGGIGYRGLVDSVGVEFDNWHNSETEGGVPISNDPSSSHVGIDVDGALHSDPVQSVPDLDDGAVRHVWVDYDGASNLLEVRMAASDVRPAVALLTRAIDLVPVLGSSDAFFGFTSGTGSAFANHDVLSWQLNSCHAPINEPTATVELTADVARSGIGVATVPVAGVDGRVLADPAAGASPDEIAATPLGSIDLGGSRTTAASPLGSIPLGSIPLGSIPLGSIPLGSISLADLPVDAAGGWRAILDCAGQTAPCDNRFSGASLQSLTFQSVLALPQVEALSLHQLDFGATPLGSIPLGSIALFDMPLGDGSVLGPNVLAQLEAACAESLGGPCDTAGADPLTLLSLALAGVPLGSIPLGSIPLGSIPLGSIELGTFPLGSIDIGATPLGSIPLGSIPLGSIPLGSIPLGSIPLGSIPLGSIPLGSIPLGSIVLNGVPLGSIPLGSIPLASIPLGSIPLGSIPLGSIQLGSIPLGSIPLGSIPLGSIPLGSIPLGSIDAVVDCTKVACDSKTLADALAAGAILPNATLSDLDAGVLRDLLGWDEFDKLVLDQLPGGTFGDLAGWQELAAVPLSVLLAEWDPGERFVLDDLVSTLFNGTTLAQLVAALPPELQSSLTLGGLLTGLLPRADYPWESVDLDAAGIRSAAVDGSPPIGYTATITVVDGPADVELEVALPAGSTYVPGSSLLGGGQVDDPDFGPPLIWPLEDLDTGVHQLRFSAKPGLTLGPTTTTATATIVGVDTSTFTGEIVDDPDVGSTPATAAPLEQDAIVLSHIGETDDVDLFKLVVGASSLLSISLSNLTFDGDLVLYSPDPGLPGDEPVLVLPPVEESVAALSTAETEAQPQTLDDVPRLDLPVYAVAAGRGTGDEVINTAPLRAGEYFIQVSGYNGGFGAEPYALRAKVLEGPDAAVCQARTLALGPHGELGDLGALPADLNTIFLVNEQRFEAMHPGELDALRAALTAAAGATDAGVVGAIIPVDGNVAVRDAYVEWDTAAGRCSPAAANRVVRAIGDVVQQVRSARPTVRNVVLVGADGQLPMGRLADTTTYANERGFGPTLSTLDEVSSSLRAGYLLSDDVYADSSPLGVGDGRLYVPDVAVGRLVHTPEQITAALDRFVATDGVIDDESGLVTGYDFLTDGADAIVDGLGADGRPVSELIDDSWTRQELAEALLPDSGPAPNLVAINAHFDPARALPAAGNAAHDETDLFTTADVRAAAGTPLVGRLLFSMGCHAGLDLPSAAADTWAKTFADQGALWVANTGYGYGDTETVALSELLMSHFAENLDGAMTVGDALTFAKHRFVSGLGAVSAYDMKSLMEATFYGLPMYRLQSGLDDPSAPPTLPVPPITAVDPFTGLSVATITVQPDLALRQSDEGDWYEAEDGTIAVSGRPLQPKVIVDVTQPGAGDPSPGRGLAKVAHGALLTDLTSSDVGGFTPRIVRPIVDLAGNEHALRPADVAFPSTFQSIRDGRSAAGHRQQLVLVPGQFVSNPATDDGIGTQRRFEKMTAEVLYAAPTAGDFEAPKITRTVSQVLPGAVAFTVDAHDGAGSVERVLVLWSVVPASPTAGPREWQAVDLGQTSPGRWSGGASVPGLTATSQVEFLVQAVDGAGNVGVSTNKGLLFHALTAPAPSDLEFTVAGPAAGGFYTGPVSIEVEGVSGTASYFLDGVGPSPLSGPISVTTDGVHTIEVTTTAGQRGSLTVVIVADGAPPVIDILSPAAGSNHVIGATVLADYRCRDLGGLGLASCVGTKPVGGHVDTASIGAKTFTVKAADVAGNKTTASTSYRVVYGVCPIGPLTVAENDTLQVDLQICNAAGGNLSSSKLAMELASVDGRSPETTSTSKGTTFKFQNGTKSYKIGIKTDGLAKGSHELVVLVSGDPLPKTVAFTVT